MPFVTPVYKFKLNGDNQKFQKIYTTEAQINEFMEENYLVENELYKNAEIALCKSGKQPYSTHIVPHYFHFKLQILRR